MTFDFVNKKKKNNIQMFCLQKFPIFKLFKTAIFPFFNESLYDRYILIQVFKPPKCLIDSLTSHLQEIFKINF